MAAENVIKAGEIEELEFGETTAPSGFNPEAEGFEWPPPGWHEMTVGNGKDDDEAFSFVQNHSWNWKESKDAPKQQWIGSQLRPRLVVASGPYKGRGVTDYIPMPQKGSGQMPAPLANRWANFLRGAGFPCPPNLVVPPGFNIKRDLPGAKCMACVVEEEYTNEETGETKKTTKVKYMGYKPIGSEVPVGSPAAGKSGGGVASGNAAEAKKAAEEFSDL